MSGQVFVVDDICVSAATEKLARFKVQQNLQIITSPNEKKKRRRRTASEIDRKYPCPEANCGKAYGSEGSLAQHIRLKHSITSTLPFMSATASKSYQNSTIPISLLQPTSAPSSRARTPAKRPQRMRAMSDLILQYTSSSTGCVDYMTNTMTCNTPVLIAPASTKISPAPTLISAHSSSDLSSNIHGSNAKIFAQDDNCIRSRSNSMPVSMAPVKTPKRNSHATPRSSTNLRAKNSKPAPRIPSLTPKSQPVSTTTIQIPNNTLLPCASNISTPVYSSSFTNDGNILLANIESLKLTSPNASCITYGANASSSTYSLNHHPNTTVMDWSMAANARDVNNCQPNALDNALSNTNSMATTRLDNEILSVLMDCNSPIPFSNATMSNEDEEGSTRNDFESTVATPSSPPMFDFEHMHDSSHSSDNNEVEVDNNTIEDWHTILDRDMCMDQCNNQSTNSSAEIMNQNNTAYLNVDNNLNEDLKTINTTITEPIDNNEMEIFDNLDNNVFEYALQNSRLNPNGFCSVYPLEYSKLKEPNHCIVPMLPQEEDHLDLNDVLLNSSNLLQQSELNEQDIFLTTNMFT